MLGHLGDMEYFNDAFVKLLFTCSPFTFIVWSSSDILLNTSFCVPQKKVILVWKDNKFFGGRGVGGYPFKPHLRF